MDVFICSTAAVPALTHTQIKASFSFDESDSHLGWAETKPPCSAADTCIYTVGLKVRMWLLANFILFRFLYDNLYFGFWEISIAKNKTRWLISALNFLLLSPHPPQCTKRKNMWFISFTSITCNKSSPNTLCFVSPAHRVKSSGVIFGLASVRLSAALILCRLNWGETPPLHLLLSLVCMATRPRISTDGEANLISQQWWRELSF